MKNSDIIKYRYYSSDTEITEEIDNEIEKLLNRDDHSYTELYPKHWRIPDSGHNVFLLLPRQKWGNNKMTKIDALHLMAESITLIESLPKWKVISYDIVSTLTVLKKGLLGTDNLSRMVETVKSNPIISAVFIVTDILTSIQMAELEKRFGVPVYDRYSIVLQIFHDHASTKVSKLQIALAEIPYIKTSLMAMKFGNWKTHQTNALKYIGGGSETPFETRNFMLNQREVKIKKLIEKLSLNRGINREKRQKMEIPVVSVVGYTNCGKTSLIKALTNDEKLQPKNVLFATLDVTVHRGLLPSNTKVLYTDTIGFISHLPMTLIQSFKSTLEDICLSHLIIHVLDISHPHYVQQKETVLRTLREIKVPEKLMSSIIEVANKIDRIDDPNKFKTEDNLLISATESIGLIPLVEMIEEKLIENGDRILKVFRVSNGGAEYQWLYRETGVKYCDADPDDYNYLIMKVLITMTSYSRFKSYFSNSFTEIS